MRRWGLEGQYMRDILRAVILAERKHVKVPYHNAAN